jgi:hypothetical protein
MTKLRYEKGPWTDGYYYEDEFIRIEQTYLDDPEEAEQYARELLQIAAEWRAKIKARGRKIRRHLFRECDAPPDDPAAR